MILGVLCDPSLFGQSLESQNTSGRTDDQKLEYFEKFVRPILIEHCYECHAAENRQGGLRLDSLDHWMAGGDSGAAIVPGQPDASRMIEAIRYANADLQMPPKGKLPDEHIHHLIDWIRDGAFDPRQSEESTQLTTPLSGMSIEEGRKFWSMVPIGNPAIPSVTQTDWVQSPIDAFLLQAMEEKGLRPSLPADRRTLLRRASLDLIGLPPTPEELAAFESDESQDAWRRAIDRLLNSPQYGVRWGRHWLDVARYADSNGLDENLAFGTAWRYRDYVVDAFNRDKPIDRFMIEQLAGDLLPNADRETRTATGFLVLGAKVLAEPDREKLTMDTIDEQIDTIGKAFMGMAWGCARCHDHKFDPIKLNDYYGLAAIFKSTKTFGDTNYGAIKHWNEYVFATPEEAESLKKVDAEIAEKQKLAADFKNQATAKLRQAVRDKAVEYLIAALQIDPATPLTTLESLAQPLGIHPRVLHHCRLHLAYHADDPFFQPWHAALENKDVEAVRAHYGSLFQKTEAAIAEQKAKDPSNATLTDPQLEAARVALSDPMGFLALPAKPEHAFDSATLDEYHRLADQARLCESFAADVPSAMAVSDGNVQQTIPIHIRGSHRNLGASVPRAFPAVLLPTDHQPILPRQQSGRLELAQWIASSSNPLTARVFVNRVWRWHFGRAIVDTTENFGALGAKPTHPELLDWLARDFIASGWSLKQLHRVILLSSAYQMSSTPIDAVKSSEVDPENRYWLVSRCRDWKPNKFEIQYSTAQALWMKRWVANRFRFAIDSLYSITLRSTTRSTIACDEPSICP